MNPVIMNVCETSKNTITEIMTHLQENSFNSFIVWTGLNCLITNLEIFPTVVLSTLFKGYSLESFIQELENFSIKYTLKKNSLKICFPNIKQKLRKRSRSGNSILSKFDEIEVKQEKLFAAILRAQEKLERAIRINKQIKFELKKSDEYQRNLIEEKSKEPHVDEIMQKLLKQVYGDQAFWDRIMDQFYERNLADKRLKRFYENTDVQRIKRMNQAFLATALRPSGEHFPISVKRAHRNMEIFGEDFEKFAQNLQITLLDNAIVKADVEEILNVIQSFRADLVKDD